ncbi:TIGR03986 family type III CRISPR-associated RAMP protein [Marinomonas sp.]|uniref:TIGR03986 family type III CRISPR-associated RAMP protein n=1 Tax=Marinomonas sp. TaxID=1904862 RepID=UPI003BA9CA04
MSVFAPYNFVPLSRFIYLPHWADQVSHDVPFSDGISGTLTVELTCHTPTLVGGTQTPATKEAPGQVEFFKDPNGKPVIPSSSLKGMISNVLEIASFARFNRLDDKRYSVRDLRANFYLNNFKNDQVKAGWLKYSHDNTRWEITPCQKVRIKQNQIIDYCNLSESTWVKQNEAHKRYQLLQGIPPITFNEATRSITMKNGKKISMQIAIPSSIGSLNGHIVTTGQPGNAFNSGRMDDSDKNKKWEFVFFNSSESSIEVSNRVMNDFLFIHSESDDWAFWQKTPSYHKETGIPVFYSTEGNKVSSLGLSSLYRLAYKNSTHEAVGHTQVSHINGTEPDLPELLFGRIQEDGSSLKGRVNIGSAKALGDVDYEKDLPPTILNGPKPTFYPAYMRQHKAQSNNKLSVSGDYQTMMDNDSELAGWKRYPVKHRANVETPQNDLGKDKKENTSVKVKLIPVKTGTRFQFNIHFHNLREVELGALLWSLTFGNTENSFHGLGMGKPYGLGRVSLALIEEETQLISMQEKPHTSTFLLKKCQDSFSKLMNDAYSFVTQDHQWLDSPQLKELIAMASPDSSNILFYMPLPAFASAKTQLKTLPSHTNASYDPLPISNKETVAVNNKLQLLTDEGYEAHLETIEAEKQKAIEVIEAEKQKAIDEEKARLEAIEAAKQKAIEDAKAKAERDALKEQLSEEEFLLTDLKKQLIRYLETGNNTARKDLTKVLQKITKFAKDNLYTEVQKQQCWALLGTLELPDPTTLKRLKKAFDESEDKDS